MLVKNNLANKELLSLAEELKKMTKKEEKSFQHYLNSPFFKIRTSTKNLLQSFLTLYPKFTETTISKFSGLKKLNQIKPSTLYAEFSYARHTIDSFYAFYAFQSDDLNKKMLQIKLTDKLDRKKFLKQQKQINELIQDLPYRDQYYYYQQFLLNTEKVQFELFNSKLEDPESLQKRQEHLDLFFIIEKLKDACEIIVRTGLYDKNYDINFINAIIKLIEKQKSLFEKHPTLQIYYYTYQMFVQTNTDLFFEFMTLFTSNQHLFTPDDRKLLFQLANNFCINQINLGNDVFLKEQFTLYKMEIEAKTIFINNKIRQWDYKNIVTTALRLKEFEFTYHFIEEYKHHLAADEKENAYTYNLANYYYSVGDYGESLRLLMFVEFKDPRYSLSAKSILLKSFYEMNETDSFYDLSRSFLKLVNQNKMISATRKKGYRTLIQKTIKMYRLKEAKKLNKPIQSKIKILHKEITSANHIFNKNWLLEKVEEVGK